MKATGGEDGYFRRWAGQHATTLEEQQRLGVPSAWLAVVAPTLADAQQRADPVDRRAAGRRGPYLHRSARRLPGAGHPLHRAASPGSTEWRAGSRTSPPTWPGSRTSRTSRRTPLTRARAGGEHPPAARPCDAGGHHLRLQPARQAAAHRLLPRPSGPGQQVALVGGSGSGKSTVSRLISGLYAPWEGVIRIDGQRLEDIPRGALAASVVLRRPGRLPLRGHRPGQRGAVGPVDPGRGGGRGAADAALYDEVITRRPGGIHSRVEQDGRNFSGGQRQRLEIARALVRRPAFWSSTR